MVTIFSSWDNFAVQKILSPKTLPLLEFEIEEAIAKERASVLEDLASYPKEEESKNRPIQSMIVTTWRSGSTFLGKVLNSHPVYNYHYEPLHQFGIAQVRSGPIAHEAVSSLTQLLTCNYTGMEGYMKYNMRKNYQFIENKRMWSHCLAGGKANTKSYCWNVQFAAQYCKLFPFQSIKTVRMRLNLTESLVADERMNVKIVLLVRDPRGTMVSRRATPWCRGHPDCEDPSRLCKDLEDDFHSFKKLRKMYPSRYKVIRYEDFSLNPEQYSKDVMHFYGVPLHDDVGKYLASHTAKTDKIPFMWRQHLNTTEVQTIQESCKPALSLWGYNLYQEGENITTFEPVLQMGKFEL